MMGSTMPKKHKTQQAVSEVKALKTEMSHKEYKTILWACKFLSECLESGEHISTATNNLREEVYNRHNETLNESIGNLSEQKKATIHSVGLAENALQIAEHLNNGNDVDPWVSAMLENVSNELRMVRYFMEYKNAKGGK